MYVIVQNLKGHNVAKAAFETAHLTYEINVLTTKL